MSSENSFWEPWLWGFNTTDLNGRADTNGTQLSSSPWGLIKLSPLPKPGNANNPLTSPLFGHSTQTLASFLGSGGADGGFNPLYQIGGPCSIRLALKLQF